MKKVILTEGERTKLKGLTGHVEIQSEAGTTIGYFLSPDAYLRFMYAEAKGTVTDVELQEARKEKVGWTTAELLAYLRSLGDNDRRAS